MANHRDDMHALTCVHMYNVRYNIVSCIEWIPEDTTELMRNEKQKTRIRMSSDQLASVQSASVQISGFGNAGCIYVNVCIGMYVCMYVCSM